MENDLSAHYKLVSDVDCSSFDYESIGDYNNQFSGFFDGKGYEVKNLEIKEGSNDQVGLFGDVADGGEVRDVGVVNFDVSGNTYVGGLVGSNHGTVHDSYSTGNLDAVQNYAGGLVGYNTGDVYRTYSNASVETESYYVGGLVGHNSGGMVSDSYSVGKVSGEGGVGGLIGWNDGSISNSYSIGDVSGNSDLGGLIGRKTSDSISSSYWDVESSGLSSSSGGVGLTTSEMQGSSAESNMSGLDFQDTWMILEGDYPAVRSLRVREVEFKETGTQTWTVPEGVSEVDVFLVGGGGGGCGRGGGGGGYTETYRGVDVSSGENVNIAVGDGGSNCENGNYSQFKSSSYRVEGGKTAGFNKPSTNHGGDGGSGGGSGAGGTGCYGGKTGAGGSDGDDGGYGYNYNEDQNIPGGNGQSTTTRAFGESDGELYAGGGGGASCSTSFSSGGAGGGGDAGDYGGEDGEPNTGGGGGAADAGTAGSGGSGIVIVKWNRTESESSGISICDSRGPFNECISDSSHIIGSKSFSISSIFQAKGTAVFEALSGIATINVGNSTSLSGFWRGSFNITTLEQQETRIKPGADFQPENGRIIIGK
jgi:hypothetical protein